MWFQSGSLHEEKRVKRLTRFSATVAGDVGFEPTNAGIKIRCLNQLGESPTLTHQTRGGGLNREPDRFAVFEKLVRILSALRLRWRS